MRTIVFLLLLVPSIARAEDHARAMYQYTRAIWDTKQHGDFKGMPGEPSECLAAVKRGNDAGLKPSDTIDTPDGTILWKKAPEVCAEYAKVFALSQVIDALRDPFSTVETFASLTPDGSGDKSVHGDVYRGTVEDAKKCVKIVDEAVAKGVASDMKFAPKGNHSETRYTLEEVKKRCNEWVTKGAANAKADDNRKAEETAALKAKYSKFGITGDRLTYLVKYGHQPVFGAKCAELSGKALKSAPAFYQLGQDDLAWIVYKTTFKGDKQTSYTSKRYRKDGNWYCK